MRHHVRRSSLLLLLFLGTPYHYLDWLGGPVSNNRFVFAAAGVLLGCLACKILAEQGRCTLAESPRLHKRLEIFSLVLGLLACSLEFAAALLYLVTGDPSFDMVSAIPFFIPYSHLLDEYVSHVSGWAAGLGSAIASFLLLQSLQAERLESAAGSKPLGRSGLLIAPVLLILGGFAIRGVWSWCRNPFSGGTRLAFAFCVLLSIALLGVLLYGLVVVSRRVRSEHSSESSPDAEEAYIQLLLGCVAVGYLGWAVVVRFLPLWSSAMRAVAVGALLAAMVILLAMRVFEKRGESHSGEAAKKPEASLQTLLIDKGLSPREFEYSLLSLQGASAKDMARTAGVMPATVRTTLHRVYKKLGVSGADELRGMLLDEEGRQGNGHDGDAAPIDRVGAVAQLASCLALAVLLFTPILWGQDGWGMGVAQIVGVSGACVCLAGYLIVQCLVGRLAAGENSPHMGKGPTIALFLLLGLACICDTCGLLRLADWIPSPMLMAAAYGGVAICLCWRCMIARDMDGVLLVAGALSVLALIALAFVESLRPVILTCYLAGCLLHPVRGNEEPVAGGGDRSETLTLLPPLFAGGLVGFFFEEVWRAAGSESYAGALVPAMGVLLLGGLGVVALLDPRYRKACVVVGCLAAAALLPIPETSFSVACIALPAFLCILFRRLGALDFAPRALLGFGFVAVASIVFVNHIQDTAYFEMPWLVDQFGGGRGYSSSVAVAICIIALMAASACCWSFWRMAEDKLVFNRRAALDQPGWQKREEAFLCARGLSDFQIQIIIGSLAGKSAREIARETNYSPSTIKAMRTASYRQLSVKGLKELVSLLSQVDGM